MYTKRELEQLLSEFNQGTPLSGLEDKLGRTAYGIALKLQRLAREHPRIWNQKKVADYIRAEIRKHKGEVKGQKERWRARRRGEHVEPPQYKQRVVAQQYIDGEERQRQQSRQYRKQHKGMWKKFGNYLANILSTYPRYKQDAAMELEIHPSSLSHYLAGNIKPSKPFLLRVSRRFNVPYQTLQNLVSYETPRVNI